MAVSEGNDSCGHPTVEIPPVFDSNESSDAFRMYDFKVRLCGRERPHDWTDCAYAHPGEKARRRDLLRFHYAGAPCADFRRTGACERGEACELAHGVFESWLHPDRYRTKPCKDGVACRRRVCFFAHTPEQLRVPRSPGRLRKEMVFLRSPRSTLESPVSYSPPLSPAITRSREEEVSAVIAAMREMGLADAPSSWRREMGAGCGSTSEVGFNRENSKDEPDVEWVSDLVD
ncbi:zinc finger CCCH domain-containing protein 23-like [Typha latifolia]|uniref:zinc finger CCCH domain-containing protein 23-like n=1 Tax=Typha latifolia TaxID=4733 RepID=UPI003C2EC032